MAENPNSTQLSEQLRQKIAEQDELRQRFESASPADSYKEEIELDDQYRPITEFRMDRSAFIVKHVPTTLLNQWAAMTGPRSLKKRIQGWVDEIHQTYPPKQEG